MTDANHHRYHDPRTSGGAVCTVCGVNVPADETDIFGQFYLCPDTSHGAHTWGHVEEEEADDR